MIKTLAVIFIAGIAGLFGYLFVSQNCRDGTLVRSRADCARQSGFDAAFCTRVFDRVDDAAMRAAIVFPLQAECQQNHDVCVQRTMPPQGWSPRATGACVVRGSDGRISRLDAVFDRVGGKRID